MTPSAQITTPARPVISLPNLAAEMSQYVPATAEPTAKTCLLVSDLSQPALALCAALQANAITVEHVQSLRDLRLACQHPHALAAVAVSPATLTEVLALIRNSETHRTIPLLVEASRLANPIPMVGVLPRFRAMACSLAELLTLARRTLNESLPTRSGYNELQRVF